MLCSCSYSAKTFSLSSALGREKYSVEVADPDISLEDFRVKVAEATNVPTLSQKLIFKGARETFYYEFTCIRSTIEQGRRCRMGSKSYGT